MEVVVDGNPKACLTKVYEHFERDWQFGGSIYRSGDAVWVEEQEKRTMFDSGPQFALFLLLTLITGGVFGFVYLFYVLLFKERDPWRVQVSALPEGSERTRLTVTATKHKQGKAVEDWVHRELVKNRAAAPEVFDKQELQDHLFGQEPAQRDQRGPRTSDIPEQIKKLADLRDSGAVTDEEFEAKKKDLLGRM